jgi:hypothetical protein
MTAKRTTLFAGGAIALAWVMAASANGNVPAKSAAATKTRTYGHPVSALGSMPESARTFYALAWGIDQVSAKLAESGQLVRVSYRVVDPSKAKAFHEKTSNPLLLDEKAHAVLQVPTMEKVGPLRQSGAPESGKSYWMVFSNKGNLVKAGHRVSVVVGQVRVDGLVVQ